MIQASQTERMDPVFKKKTDLRLEPCSLANKAARTPASPIRFYQSSIDPDTLSVVMYHDACGIFPSIAAGTRLDRSQVEILHDVLGMWLGKDEYQRGREDVVSEIVAKWSGFAGEELEAA